MSVLHPADDYAKQRHPRRSPIAPLLIGAALTVIALAGQTRLGCWLRGFLAPRHRHRRDLFAERPIDGISPAELREAILGRRKSSIAAAYGPPRTAVVTGTDTAVARSAGFWRADTWYYAIDAQSQTAMSIRFDRDFATEVEFFEAPKPDA